MAPFGIILVTGKGWPDINTRQFLHRLSTDLPHLNFVALVDGDPYGIEIFLGYKYGSLKMAYWPEPLALPKLQWIGVFPSEFPKLQDSLKDLSQRDKKRVEALLKRPYMTEDVENELRIMQASGKKAEIEDLECPGHYLWDVKLSLL